MRWRLVGRRRGGGRGEFVGRGAWSCGRFFSFWGERDQETVENRLSDVGERGEDGKGAVNGRERWRKRGGRVEDVRGGRFWEGNFGVVDGGEGREESFCLLFCFLDFFGRSCRGRYSSLSSQREGKGGGEEGGRRGKRGGRERDTGLEGKRGRERRRGEEGRDGNEEVVNVEERGRRENRKEGDGGRNRGGNDKIRTNDLIFEKKSVISYPTTN